MVGENLLQRLGDNQLIYSVKNGDSVDAFLQDTDELAVQELLIFLQENGYTPFLGGNIAQHIAKYGLKSSPEYSHIDIIARGELDAIAKLHENTCTDSANGHTFPDAKGRFYAECVTPLFDPEKDMIYKLDMRTPMVSMIYLNLLTASRFDSLVKPYDGKQKEEVLEKISA